MKVITDRPLLKGKAMEKINNAAIEVIRDSGFSKDIRIWWCFGKFPECDKNCHKEMMEKCRIFIEVGDAVAIESETDGRKN